MSEREAEATHHDEDGAAPTEATKREGLVHSDRGARKKPDEQYLSRGTLIGRYVVFEKLGEGGMGVVYSAYDPELDRKVAIKLLQARDGGSQGGDQAWLLREAQALARLQHPNVVAVHDVGTLPGDRVFVAMELVDGVTLRKWLKGTPKSWREIVPVLVAAGEGLVAAHAAGLVHRDFKPDNVLVGNDGRVRVMDFGLARLRPGGGADSGPTPRISASDLNIDTKSPLTDSLTMVGSVIGTPAYMAPEIFDGTPADAVTDQFAFAVTVFEALFRARPFTKEQLMPPRAADTRPKIPVGTKVPMRIQRAMLRALAIDPAQRFSAVDGLLAELRVDPNVSRRRAMIGGGLVAVAGGAFALSFAMHRGPEPCTGIDQQLAGVWDADMKGKVKTAFLATKKPLASGSFDLLERALDNYTRDWTTTAIGSCRATRVAKNQTEEVLSLRQTCLDQRRGELAALTKILLEPTPAVVDKADKIAWELEPIAECNNVELLRAPGQPPAAIAPKVVAAQTKLSEAKAQMIADGYFPAMVASQKALDLATEAGWPPLIAEAMLVRASALARTGNATDAAKLQIDATWMAVRAKRDDLAAKAAVTAAMTVSDGFGKPGEGKIYLQLSEELAKRNGIDKLLEHTIQSSRGLVLAEAGDLVGAVDAHQRAFDAAVSEHGLESPALWSDEYMLATTLTNALSYERSIKHYEHAIKLREKTVGPDHIDIALLVGNVGISYGHVLDEAKARAAFERTIAIRKKLFGKANALLVVPLVNYADFLNRIGKSEEALPLIEQARKLAVPLPGVEHPTYHSCDTTYCEVIAKLGRRDEARKELDELLAIEQRVKSSILPTTQTSRAELELGDKAYAEAAKYAQLAIDGFEAASGPENPELWKPLTRLAQAKIALGDKEAAKPLLERAVAIGSKSGLPAHELEEARDLLAGL